jgi:hypothetical protein
MGMAPPGQRTMARTAAWNTCVAPLRPVLEKAAIASGAAQLAWRQGDFAGLQVRPGHQGEEPLVVALHADQAVA